MNDVDKLRKIFYLDNYSRIMEEIPKNLHSIRSIGNKINIDKINLYDSDNKILKKYTMSDEYEGCMTVDLPDIQFTYNTTNYSFSFYNPKNTKAACLQPTIFILKRNNKIMIRTGVEPGPNVWTDYYSNYTSFPKFYREVHFQQLNIGFDVSCKDNVYKIDNDLLADLSSIDQMIFDKKEDILEKNRSKGKGATIKIE